MVYAPCFARAGFSGESLVRVIPAVASSVPPPPLPAVLKPSSGGTSGANSGTDSGSFSAGLSQVPCKCTLVAVTALAALDEIVCDDDDDDG